MANKWDKAHMEAARVYAGLSSAIRAKVGAVIVKNNRIISIGYNGMPSGWDNKCEDEFWGNGSPTLKTKPEVLHAEANAILKVARSSDNCEGATIYCTMMPCLDCAKLIYQSGIERIVYDEDYPKGSNGVSFLEKCNLNISKLD